VENIFKSLAKQLADVEREANGVRQLIAHAMASRLLLVVFGRNWYERNVVPR